MINIEEIDKEIKRLEEGDCTSYNVCDKLATLYIVRKYFSESRTEKDKNTSPMMMGIK